MISVYRCRGNSINKTETNVSTLQRDSHDLRPSGCSLVAQILEEVIGHVGWITPGRGRGISCLPLLQVGNSK